jgi:hypothetical protein
MIFGVWLLFSLLSGWFVRTAARHPKDPDKGFYLGNVAPSGRKYVGLAFLAFLVATIAFFSNVHG